MTSDMEQKPQQGHCMFCNSTKDLGNKNHGAHEELHHNSDNSFMDQLCSQTQGKTRIKSCSKHDMEQKAVKRLDKGLECPNKGNGFELGGLDGILGRNCSL